MDIQPFFEYSSLNKYFVILIISHDSLSSEGEVV